MIALFFVLISSTLSLSDYCGPWPVLGPNQVPLALPSDSVDVFYMAAPLLYCTNLDEYTYINGYHGGIGLRNRRSGLNITVNFEGFPSFKGSFLPVITELSIGSVHFQWQNGGKTFIYPGINMTYWHSLNEKVATMNGLQFNEFMKWVALANATFTHYNPWFVYKSFPDQPLLTGFECFQFALKSVQKVRELGAVMVPGIDKLYVSLGTSYADVKPILVDYWDPVWHDRIEDFYMLLDEKWNDLGYIKFLEALWDLIVDGDFFVRDNDSYYYYQLAFPFFGMHWSPMPIDSIGRRDTSVNPLSQK